MGQSVKRGQSRESKANAGSSLSIFPTILGWCGIVGQKDRVQALLIGHFDDAGVRDAVTQRLFDSCGDGSLTEFDWHPRLRERLIRYASGKTVTFDDIQLDLPQGTQFQKRVLAMTRKIPYGQTLTYGDLADRAGSPRAARAVGSVMASNRFPIVIPCHRVVASGGKLGGFSAPQGIDLKARLLAMEAETVASGGLKVTARSES
ncbi:MAG: methylated-DNA--[protein]-cysteine S-methyltransferase [Planctomycetaceae bacterium]|nr:methylated-DNA--[protein]-cysteine S-methyltransferase [Planctomycetaceae bacterium]